MSWLVPALVASLLATFVLAGTVAYLYHRYRRPFLRTWIIAWGLYALRFAGALGVQAADSPVLRLHLLVFTLLAALWSGFFLLAGVYLFIDRRMPRSHGLIAGLLTLWTVVAAFCGFTFFTTTLPVFFFLGYVNIVAGVLFLRQNELPLLGRRLTGWSFILWGLHKLDYPLLRTVGWFAPWGYLASAALEVLVALGTMLTYLDQTHSRLRQREKDLELALTTYQTLTANLPDIVYRIDVKAGGRIRYFNDAARTITGYGPEELAGGRVCPIEDLVVAEDRLRVVGVLQEAIDYQKPFSVQYRFRDREGRIHYVSDKGTPIFDSGGDLLCIDGLIHDFTEMREAEQERENLQRQLRQAQKLEAIGTLAGGIAHDFNNILSAIIGFTELSLYEHADLPAPVRANLEEVMRAANRARSLVKQILSFSRQREQERTVLQLQPVVKEVVKLLRATVPSSISIGTDIEEATSPVLAEPIQMHQLLMNLATNAVQAMDGKGDLFVRLGNVVVDGDSYPDRPDIPSGRYVRLEVEDTGCGMDQEVLERIFDPFFTTKAPGEGTGMGLAVVYGIVQRHKGFIVVRSEPGRGSVFTVLLPPSSVSAHTASGVLAADARLPGGHERLLLVDDERAIVTYIERLLAWLGYQVWAFTDSQEALDFLRRERVRPDLLLTDQTMPGLTGTELAVAVRELFPGTPVVLCTGYGARLDEHEVRRAGIGVVLAKPVSRDELARTVRRLLDEAAQTAGEDRP